VYIVKETPTSHPLILEAFCLCLFLCIHNETPLFDGAYFLWGSIVMIGFVPLSVPLIEVCVLITAFWFLEKTRVSRLGKATITWFLWHASGFFA